jgi:hypothetical protein
MPDGDADAAPDAVAVDHGEERLGQVGERVVAGGGDAAVLLLVGHVAPPVLELRDVGARHEGLLAGAAQHDHADGVVGDELVHVFGHELPHLLTHGVPLLRLVENDPADRPVLFHQELFRVAHAPLLVG